MYKTCSKLVHIKFNKIAYNKINLPRVLKNIFSYDINAHVKVDR